MARLLRKVAGAVPAAVWVGLTVAAAVWAFFVYRLPEPQRGSQATYGAFLVAIIVGLPALTATAFQVRKAIKQRLHERVALAPPPKLKRTEAALKRWAPVTKGNLSSALLRLTTTIQPNHPSYSGEKPGTERPKATLAMAFAALPPPTEPATGALDDMLRALVTAPETAAWIMSLTAEVSGSGWLPWDAWGQRSLCSVLIDKPQAEPSQQTALAWARINLPDEPAEPRLADESMNRLSLVVQVTPLDDAGDLATPRELETWVTVVRRGLAVAQVMARSAERYGYQLLAQPEPEVAVSLKAEPSLTSLVETATLHVLPGNRPSTWALLSARAVPDGVPAGECAVALVRYLCDYALHVRGYEPRLSAALRPRRPRLTP